MTATVDRILAGAREAADRAQAHYAREAALAALLGPVAACAAIKGNGRHCQHEPQPWHEGLDLPPFIALCWQHANQWHDWKRARELAEARARAEAKRAAARAATVYYAQRADGLIKIGYTARLASRMATLRREHGALDLLATHAGGRDAEQAQHRRFDAHRVTGEWFHPAPELLAHIARINERKRRTSKEKAAA